jgi:indole-3-glycerol phosphate synthase
MTHRTRSRLDGIVAGVREDLERRKREVPFPLVERRARAAPRRREIRSRLGPGPGLIAEVKRASPSQGWMRKELDAAAAARAYAEGGACAVSVLTEARLFGGALEDLVAASAASGAAPVLRKDFVLDEYMVAESRAHGADLVLLIVAVLGERTGRMVRLAADYGMEALVEVHDEEEMAIAEGAGATCVGINNRDLGTLRVDLCTSERLLPKAPHGALKVVESGISRAEDVRRFHAMGADAFLVGEALVRSRDPVRMMRYLTRDARYPETEKETGEWKPRLS